MTIDERASCMTNRNQQARINDDSYNYSINNIIRVIHCPMIKSGKWRCEVCDFDNIDDLTSCEMCQTPSKKELKQIQMHQDKHFIEKEPGIICPDKSCAHYNSLHADICSSCKKFLFGDFRNNRGEKQIKRSKMKFCYKCGFENDSSNSTCVNCDISLLLKVIPNISVVGPFGGSHTGKTTNNILYCQDCGGMVSQIDPKKARFGLPVTYDDYICLKCAKLGQSDEKLCIFCDKHLTKQEAQFHDDICQPRAAFFKREGNPTFDRCTKMQIQTISYMHKKCQKFHQQNKFLLIRRIKKLGYKENDLENLHHYIMHYAPIIIHMRVQNHFQFFVKDTHYRNCFEVRGDNIGRVQWEDRMFDNKHHHASFYERVKYGTMNFTNDPKGVNACQGYGQSYFLLKSHVRDRCTITDMDSASPMATLGTFRFVFHVLMKLSDAELKAAFEGSKGKEMLSNVIGAYKQIQIHGPVQFAKDIERVYLCKQEFMQDKHNLQQLAKQFCEKNKLQYEFFDRKGTHPIGYGFGGFHIVKEQKAPERVIGDIKSLDDLDQQQVGGYYPHLSKPSKKNTRKK